MKARTEREKRLVHDSIGVGMVIAAAIIVDESDVYAEEVLGAAGLTSVKDMRACGCDDYDIEKLRPLIAEMHRRKMWDRRKATRALSVAAPVTEPKAECALINQAQEINDNGR